MYEERFYRGFTQPNGLVCYEVKYKETDLLCCTKGNLKDFIEDRVLFYRHQLEEYIRLKPVFMHSLVPVEYDKFAPVIVREMVEASSEIGVGPMATVAGAIAEFERDLINERVREGIEAAKKKGIQFGRKAILGNKDKNFIHKQHEKGKSVEWLSKLFHVARNTIYRAIKDVDKKK